MKNIKIFVLLTLLLQLSTTYAKSLFRVPAASNDKAIQRVSSACDVSSAYLSALVNRNSVQDQARYLSGGEGHQTFLMNDGRLVVVSGVSKSAQLDRKCDIDHLKLDEGDIKETFALGRRLFMAVENKQTRSRRVYVLTAVKNKFSVKPYDVHELKYSKKRSYAQAFGFKRQTVKVGRKNKYGVAVVKRDGKKYANRVFKPWEWGANNETILANTNAREITVRDERQSRSFPKVKHVHNHPKVIYLPKPAKKSCYREDKISFFFGLFSFTETVSVYCR